MDRAGPSTTAGSIADFLEDAASWREASVAAMAAAQRAAAALDADVAAVLLGDGVEAAVGFPEAIPAPGELRSAAAKGALEVPGLGERRLLSVSLGSDPPGMLLVGREARAACTDEQRGLLDVIGRVLALALRALAVLDGERALRRKSEAQALENARLLSSIRERQRLLERLSRVQRSIAAKADLDEVLDSIVSGAAALLRDEVVALRLIDRDDPSVAEVVSSTGIGDTALDAIRVMPTGAGAGGSAIEQGRLVVIEGYQDAPEALAVMRAEGVRAVMAAPVRERGRIVGSLTVATRAPGRTYTDSEREALVSLAEHAGLALNDARAAAETAHQAFHDSLTGLPNRDLFVDRLEHALVRSIRHGSGVAVLFCDLDGFKAVNDSLGHDAGDELLRMVGERLEGCLRAADTAARLGGDEFAVLIEDVEDDGAPCRVAARILGAFGEGFQVRGREAFVTASIGIATGTAEAEHLLRNADLAMYRAKSRGKGRYEVYVPEMRDAVVARLELEVDLRRALERDELILHYQPVCRLDTGEITAVEALVRWRHPIRGLIAPGGFIPVAEESRQIVSLGRWVLREACRQGARWERRGPDAAPLDVSVNVSGVQLEQPELLGDVRAALADSGLDPGRLVLEITETALVANMEANVAKLRELKALGVQLAVDDFGAGYSSLEDLRRFPVDVLKIARSFVEGMHDPRGAAVAHAIVDLAESFGFTVVAEGVEQREQRDRLLGMGCELGQGFHFARPQEPEEIGARLAAPLSSAPPLA
jgi:diguanylate cyclase (GGDEF)-like protein